MSAISAAIDLAGILTGARQKNLPVNEKDLEIIPETFEQKLTDLTLLMLTHMNWKKVATDLNKVYVDGYIGKDIQEIWDAMHWKLQRLSDTEPAYTRLVNLFHHIQEEVCTI